MLWNKILSSLKVWPNKRQPILHRCDDRIFGFGGTRGPSVQTLTLRYMQRFDPGFGFNGGSYTIQPMYAPVLNYNTEFPQLGSTHGPQLPTEHQPRPIPQHLPGPWAAPSTPAGIGYGHPEPMMSPFSPNQVGAHSSSTMFLHSSQYPCQRPGMPFIHHEHVHRPFTQCGSFPGITRDVREDALEVATDPDYRFELAMQLGRLEVAKSIATEVQGESTWKQLGDLAMSIGKLEMAEECLKNAMDLSGSLLLYSSLGDAEGISNLATLAKGQGKNNVAFLCMFNCWVNVKTVFICWKRVTMTMLLLHLVLCTL